MAFTHTIYDNFYLSNEVEDQYNSHLDLQQFCTVDNSLVGQAGMKRKVNVYKATDGTEKLAMGAGNTKTIQVSYTDKEYEILLAQNRFEYYDEQAMTDPMLVPVAFATWVLTCSTPSTRTSSPSSTRLLWRLPPLITASALSLTLLPS